MYNAPVPVSRERHASKRLIRFTEYSFARSTAIVPVFPAELSHVAAECPIAFVKEADGYAPVALLAPEPGQNLFVAPDGRWLGGYVPASLRRYPFVLGRPTDSSDLMLCVDEESGLLSDTDGELLYDENGQISAFLSGLMNFLGQLEHSRSAAVVACAALERHQLIVPWDLTIASGTGPKNVVGLFRVDEGALNQLSDEAFLDLRRNGALPLSYAHLISTQRLSIFERLNTIQNSLKSVSKAAPTLDLNEMFEAPGGNNDLVFKF